MLSALNEIVPIGIISHSFNDIDLFLQGLRPLVLKEYKRILTNHLYQQVNTDDYRTYILNEIYN